VKNFKLAALAMVVGMTFAASDAMALQSYTQSVTANIGFDTPLSITKNSDIDFGFVKAAQAGTYVISTADAVTPSGGGVWLYGSPHAASLTVIGSTTQTLTVSVGTYAVNGGVTPSAATCAYNGGSEAACGTLTTAAAPGAGKTLLVGVQVVADGTQDPLDTAAPTFDVTVTYN
jgi:hypothetical protein